MKTFPQQSDPSKEGRYSVSKWLKYHVLLDEEELKGLIENLPSFRYYKTGQVLPIEESTGSSSEFLDKYRLYIRDLIHPSFSKQDLTCVWSVSSEALYSIKVKENKVILRPKQPVLQIQNHQFLYSSLDRSFRSMINSLDSIPFGIEISYPQIFEDPHSHEFIKVRSHNGFENNRLFSQLSHWIRHHTVPMCVILDHQSHHLPIRIGKKVLSWVHLIPSLENQPFKISLASSVHGLCNALRDLFVKQKKTLILAESCTGGYLAHLLTSIAGSSSYFLGSLVVYRAETKKRVSNIEESLLSTYGEVSKETTAALMKSLFNQVDADYALSVTGYLSSTPSSLESSEIDIWVSIGHRGGREKVWPVKVKGGRNQMKEESAFAIMKALYDFFREEEGLL
ncbi:MAG: CinA family protein [Rhabdochlamydiaceae bacterium]